MRVSNAVANLVLLLGALSCTGCVDSPRRVAAPVAATLPFKLELVEVTPSALPGLHSFACASAAGKWLILGGRVAGLHGFGSGIDNFPRSSANANAFVIDPLTNQVLGLSDLTQLSPKLAGPLTATNPESLQVGNSLYIVGGYGKDLEDPTGQSMVTFGSMVIVDVPGLIQAIVGKTPIAPYFTCVYDNRLKVTGGELKSVNGLFCLVFGQQFDGNYSVQDGDYNRAGGEFQKYTQKVRVFTLGPKHEIQNFDQKDGGYDSSLPYNRRDLNVVDVILGDGQTPGATVYGGVFKAGQVAGYVTPIDLNGATGSAGNPTINVTNRPDFTQGLSHYDCAEVTVYDAASSSCYTTLFGGISQYRYDASTQTLIRDEVDLPKGIDGLPFINTVSTIQRATVAGTGEAVFSQFILPTPLPGLLGAEARFLPLATTPAFGNGVLKLASLSGRTLVGHVYGGIGSAAPYSALATTQPSTWASNRLFQVYITPGPSPANPLPLPLPPPTPYSPSR
ncbi:MAG: hypothetical protein HYZ53_27880 [Planctomycetes bacterium]|nr:hypothetical protein [Planctomycetota bacterium]